MSAAPMRGFFRQQPNWFPMM